MKPRHERAAQFAPFAALRGFEEEIARRREKKCPRRELAEGEIERLSGILASLSLGDTVSVCYYKTDRYLTVCGLLTAIDPIAHTLTVVREVIPFCDLFDLSRVGGA